MARKTCTLLFLPFLILMTARAQSDSTLPNAPDANLPDAPTLSNLPGNILHDQGAIWTSPMHLNEKNAIAPLIVLGATAVLVTTDHQVMSQHFLDKKTNDHANTASTGLTGLFIAAPVAFFGMGHIKHDAKAEETGVLGGEAILDSVAVSEVIKIVSRRERPTVDGAKGKFFQPGVNFDSSFDSNHSVIAWSSAAVIASEYDGPMTQIAAYGLATGVSLTRIIGRDHFPSDVLVGSAVGWMIGRYVHHRHHRADMM